MDSSARAGHRKRHSACDQQNPLDPLDVVDPSGVASQRHLLDPPEAACGASCSPSSHCTSPERTTHNRNYGAYPPLLLDRGRSLTSCSPSVHRSFATSSSPSVPPRRCSTNCRLSRALATLPRAHDVVPSAVPPPYTAISRRPRTCLTSRARPVNAQSSLDYSMSKASNEMTEHAEKAGEEATYRPTEHGGKKKDGSPDKRVSSEHGASPPLCIVGEER